MMMNALPITFKLPYKAVGSVCLCVCVCISHDNFLMKWPMTYIFGMLDHLDTT